MKKEIWNNIPNINGYQASSLGRIKSKARIINRWRDGVDNSFPIKETILKTAINKFGYETTQLPNKTWLVHRLVALSKREWKRERTGKFVDRLQEIREWMFTCLRYDFVPATNNNSEGDIRKLVLSRKISGCHRSELGIHSREIMMSLILTETHKGNNPIEFIRSGIAAYNNT